MRSWERDLLDHLALLTVMNAERPLTVDEAVEGIKREFPALDSRGATAPNKRPDGTRPLA